VVLLLVLVFGIYFCVVSWKARTDAKNKALIDAEVQEFENEL
jgi:hypothetical protein